MVFVISSDYEFPITFVETSEDGHTVYIEPTEKEGFKTLVSLKNIRDMCPQFFPKIISEALVSIPTPYELSQLLSETEELMNIKINNIAHTLRLSKELNMYERVLVPVEKFLNPLIASLN